MEALAKMMDEAAVIIVPLLKKMWLRDTYTMSYDTAVRGDKLYFDERHWSKNDVQVFFQDLSYGDNSTYELCVYKLGRVCNSAAQKRFKSWVAERHA